MDEFSTINIEFEGEAPEMDQEAEDSQDENTEFLNQIIGHEVI